MTVGQGHSQFLGNTCSSLPHGPLITGSHNIASYFMESKERSLSWLQWWVLYKVILPWEKWCSVTCDIYRGSLTKRSNDPLHLLYSIVETSHRLPCNQRRELDKDMMCWGSHLKWPILCLTSLSQPNVYEICPYWWVPTLFILFHCVKYSSVWTDHYSLFHYWRMFGMFLLFVIMNIAVVNILIHVSRGPYAFVSLGLYLSMFSFFPPYNLINSSSYLPLAPLVAVLNIMTWDQAGGLERGWLYDVKIMIHLLLPC